MNQTLPTDIIQSLIDSKKWNEAAERCFSELTQNPSQHQVRLLLARIFFEQGRIAFAAREVAFISSKLPENMPVKKLLAKLSPEGIQKSTVAQETVISESEFSIDEIEGSLKH